MRSLLIIAVVVAVLAVSEARVTSKEINRVIGYTQNEETGEIQADSIEHLNLQWLFNLPWNRNWDHNWLLDNQLSYNRNSPWTLILNSLWILDNNSPGVKYFDEQRYPSRDTPMLNFLDEPLLYSENNPLTKLRIDGKQMENVLQTLRQYSLDSKEMFLDEQVLDKNQEDNHRYSSSESSIDSSSDSSDHSHKIVNNDNTGPPNRKH